MKTLPEPYQRINNDAICNIMPEAEKIIMVVDEVIAKEGNYIEMYNDKVHVTVRNASKCEKCNYLSSI